MIEVYFNHFITCMGRLLSFQFLQPLRRFGSPLISPQLTPRRSCVTVNVPNLSGSAESRLNFFFLLYQKNRTEERTNYQNLSL